MNRRERKKEETRANIIDYAIGLFKEKGFQKTSVEEIAEKADISKATLYNYFKDKESILSAFFQSSVADYSEEQDAILKDCDGIKARLSRILDFKNSMLGNDMELTGIYLRYRMQSLMIVNPFDNPQRSGLENLILKIITDAQGKGEIRKDIPALTMARAFLLTTVNYFLSSIYIKEQDEIDRLREHLVTLFLNGASK